MRNVNIKDAADILPFKIFSIIQAFEEIHMLQEIRIKINKPVIIQIGSKEFLLNYIASEEDLKLILQRISNYSIYAVDEDLKQGYITIKGGHRVGICGTCVMQDNAIKTIKDIGSINIRICREIIGCSDKIMPYIIEKESVKNTIIISPPKCGKTTLLRDISRNISDGFKRSDFKGKKVCIVDERSEIAACCRGAAQMKVGIRTDVLDNCPKSCGIMMAVRSMSPDVIICDEIGTDKDMESIITAMNCGVNLITSIHGFEIDDLLVRPVFKKIVDNMVFKRAVVLSSGKGVGTVEYIYDFDVKEKIWRKQYE